MDKGFGKYDVYAVAGSVYCYRDTDVLKNRFGLRDNVTLKAVETDFSTLRQTELLSKPIEGRFTTNHLCRIHQYLLGDVYSFAGHFRREDIMKGSTRFIAHSDIGRKLKKLLSELCEENLLIDLPFDAYIERTSYYFAELNYIHPFREGNGRAIREFMRQLFDAGGYEVDWAAVPTEELLSAMEASVFDTTTLQGVLKKCLTPME